MSKWISISVFILMISFFTSAQSYKIHWKRSLNGNVKSVSEVRYKAIEKNGQILKREGMDSSHTIFNEKGSYVELYLYKPDGREELDAWLLYNEKENTVQYISFTQTGGDMWKQIFKYNSNGNLVEEEWSNLDGIRLSEKHSYVYDEHGNAIEESKFSKGKEVVKYGYKYNEKNEMIESNVYKPDGTLSERQTYKHDEQGNLIESGLYRGEGKLSIKTVYKYIYDENLNWIKRITIQDGIPITVSESVIVY